jgi:glycosyltransferase involved in cell wall biosynthesis
VPFDATVEAFGQTYVEALASGVPSVFTLSGIAPNFINHRKNAMVVKYKSAEEIYLALKELIDNPRLAKNLALNGIKDVENEFTIEVMINKLESLYN